MKAVIFANGALAAPARMNELLDEADLILAANGGTRHALALNRMPDLVVGDLDSLEVEDRESLEAANVSMQQHRADKDKSDLELSFMEAKGRGAIEVVVLGALGRRWDSSLSNILLAALPQFAKMKILFLHGVEQLQLIRKKARLQAEKGARLSLIPLGGDAQGVHTRGLDYALEGETLHYGSSRGVSNVFTGEVASISLESGLLLCVASPAEFG